MSLMQRQALRITDPKIVYGTTSTLKALALRTADEFLHIAQSPRCPSGRMLGPNV
jgi:hypothetical protein